MWLSFRIDGTLLAVVYARSGLTQNKLPEKTSKTFIHEKHEKHERKNNTLSMTARRLGCNPSFLAIREPGYVPGDWLLGLHPSLQGFFFVLFVFFVDQAVAFDVFGGCI